MLIRSLFIIGFILLPHLAFAGETKTDINAQTGSGIYRVNAYNYLNSWGRREVRLESNIVGAVQGYGRDTDDDGKVDTWFMLSREEGLMVIPLPSRQTWGHDVVRTQLFKRYQNSALASAASAYGSVMSMVLVSSASASSALDRFWRELIDLEEFAIRLKRSKDQGHLNHDQWRESVDLLMKGYDEALGKFDHAMGPQYWTLVGADIGLWVSGGIILKGAGKALAFLGKPLSGLPLVSSCKEVYKAIAGKFIHRYRREMARLRVIRGVSAKVLTTSALKQGFPRTMRSLMSKNMLLRRSVPVVGRLGAGMRKATLGWRYIAFMGGLQLATESFAHYDEVKSPDPTEFAKNVMNHPEIIQNVSYMTSDAYLMTVASHSVKKPKLKFAMGGFIAMTNSGITNLVIRGDRDYKRVALDTSWEAVIGNAQIQLDLKALSHFERLAEKNKNPRLKFIGWAIVLVDQVAGFAGYSAATAVIDGERKDVKLVPVHVMN